MTKLLQKAFAEASKLPEPEQEALAEWLLEELASERRWTKSFGRSEEALGGLADEALTEYREGRTRQLDPEKL